MAKLALLISIFCFSLACDLEDYDGKTKQDYISIIVYSTCEIDGQIIYYPSGECIVCQYGYWQKMSCSDFPGCDRCR